jgi:hypothetical protein
VEWLARSLAGDSVQLRITKGDSAVVDTLLHVPEDGVLATPSLPPGAYDYLAHAGSRGGVVVQGSFDVESHTDELRHPPAHDLPSVAAASLPGEAAAGGRRPLRTHPLPYFLLLGLLCGEWIGRRRKGLR